MAASLRGRVTRAAWLAPYYARTPAQKLATDTAHHRCMTHDERVAMVAYDYTRLFGHLPALHCVATRLEARSRAVRLAVTTRLLEFRLYDRVFRACGFMGDLYARFGRQMKLETTRPEQACMNRAGSVVPLYPLHAGDASTNAERAQVAAVFDRCVGSASEEAMWRRASSDVQHAIAVACVARQLSRAATFGMLFTEPALLAKLSEGAAVACGVPVTVTVSA
jgi:hypothetical protein